MASKFHSIVVKEITSNRNICKQINFINCFHSSRQKSQFWYPYCIIIVSVAVSVRHTVSLTESCTFAFKLQRFRLQNAFPIIFSNQSDPTKLLNFASFSHSLRNIQSLYPRGIMYIQSRRNSLKLDTGENARRKHMSLGAEFPWSWTRPKDNLCRTQPLAVCASAPLRRAKWASHEADGCRAFVRQLLGSRLFLPDVVGWANLFKRQYTAKITAFSRHFVSRTFENIELNSRTIEGTCMNRKDKFENIRGFRGFCADPAPMVSGFVLQTASRCESRRPTSMHWRMIRIDTDFRFKSTDSPHEIVACLQLKTAHARSIDRKKNYAARAASVS